MLLWTDPISHLRGAGTWVPAASQGVHQRETGLEPRPTAVGCGYLKWPSRNVGKPLYICMEGRGLVLFLFLPHKGSDHSLWGGGQPWWGWGPHHSGAETTAPARPRPRHSHSPAVPLDCPELGHPGLLLKHGTSSMVSSKQPLLTSGAQAYSSRTGSPLSSGGEGRRECCPS